MAWLRGVLTGLLLAAVLVGCDEDAPAGAGQTTCSAGEQLVEGICQRLRPDLSPDGPSSDAGEDPDVSADPDVAADVPGDAPEPECEPDTRLCFATTTVAVCTGDGFFEYEDCEEGATCAEGFCEAPETVCAADETVGCADDTHLLVCNEARTAYEPVPCPEESPNCLFSLGACSDMVCVTESVRCDPESENTIQSCNEDGSAWEFDSTCPIGTLCDNGGCLSPCDANAKDPSFLGCDYWAVDLDNLEEACSLFETDECETPGETCNADTDVCEPSAAGQQFSVAISNPHAEAVEVTITNVETGAETTSSVAPGTATMIPLERLDVSGTGITRNAYRIATSLPITAHQFNPANNVGVYSNDASLLLPSNVAGLRFVVLTWPTGPYGVQTDPIGTDFNRGAFGYATVVAVSEGTTRVTVTPTADVAGGGSVPDMNAGEATTIDLEEGDVLNLETEAVDGLDLSGTSIEADKPVFVFAGHECAFVPDQPLVGYCDHLEEQMVPVEAWGTQYLATKFSPRGDEPDVYRIVAATDATLIRTNPVIDGVNGVALDAGEVFEFESANSFQIDASGPILLEQFMVGSGHPDIPLTCAADFGECDGGTCAAGLECDTSLGFCVLPCERRNDCRRGGLARFNLECGDSVCMQGGVGDPANVLQVPTSQFREDYIFLTPGGFRHDWATVVAPTGAALSVDGTPISANDFTPIGETGFSLAYIDTADSGAGDPQLQHAIEGDQPFGLSVYGYDCDVSYAYPGGLNLEGVGTE